MRTLKHLFPENDNKRKWIAISITVVIAGLLTLWGIHGIGEYGIALFVLTPIFIGVCPTLLYGMKGGISTIKAWQISVLSLLLFTAGLILFAMEGIICILMAAPIALLCTYIGAMIGYFILKKKPNSAIVSMLLLGCSIPALAFVEKEKQPALTYVETAIDIDATPEEVWKNVIEFPQLAEPTELLFKAGIAYPIDANIDGTGVGAVRHCNFTTGSFVEPITEWDEPKLLQFNVDKQPAPMKELSFWDIDAPHLHDYFVSKKGRFKLTALPSGRTRLEGTTWYYHDIKPAIYWQLWSNYIVHKIHRRVLQHIKVCSEN